MFPPCHPTHTHTHTLHKEKVPVYYGLHGTTVYCTPCSAHDNRDEMYIGSMYYHGELVDTVASQATTIPLRDTSGSTFFGPDQALSHREA